MKDRFQSRISYQGDIGELSRRVCRDFRIGDLISDSVVRMGYEDLNIAIETSKGKYLAKIFADFRDDDCCKRYVDIVSEALKAGVHIPRLLPSPQGYLHRFEIDKSWIRLCLMDFIEGKTFFELKTKPTPKEIVFLADQAALINSIDLRPNRVYDDWAVVNLENEFNKKSAYLPKKDLSLVQPVISEFRAINHEQLPACFVHGDLISINAIKGKDENLWIIDFSVSNTYPRIQELAVLACDLLFDEKNRTRSEKNLVLALGAYQKRIHLTQLELESLPTYVRAAHAMHVIGATHQKKAKGNKSRENEYFLRIGRAGLNQSKIPF
ncbi:MAG: phosphotransferase [Nanoarchaeota archaeon]